MVKIYTFKKKKRKITKSVKHANVGDDEKRISLRSRNLSKPDKVKASFQYHPSNVFRYSAEFRIVRKNSEKP